MHIFLGFAIYAELFETFSTTALFWGFVSD